MDECCAKTTLWDGKLHGLLYISRYSSNKYNELNAMDGKLSETVINLQFKVPDNCSFYSLYRSAVRSDAGEDRTVPHTVTLRSGAMQRHASEYCF